MTEVKLGWLLRNNDQANTEVTLTIFELINPNHVQHRENSLRNTFITTAYRL